MENIKNLRSMKLTSSAYSHTPNKFTFSNIKYQQKTKLCFSMQNMLLWKKQKNNTEQKHGVQQNKMKYNTVF